MKYSGVSGRLEGLIEDITAYVLEIVSFPLGKALQLTKDLLAHAKLKTSQIEASVRLRHGEHGSSSYKETCSCYKVLSLQWC